MVAALTLVILIQHLDDVSSTRQLAACHNVIVHAYETKVTSPRPYPNYHHECWVLNSADGSSRIELNVDYFWIDLVGDAVNIYDGDSVAAYQLNGYGGFSDEWEDHMLGPYDEFHPKYDKKLSKLRKPFVWLSTVSSGPSMFIDFLTDGTGTGLGFRVSLNMRPASPTSLTSNHTVKYLHSPNAPNVYDANTNWRWIVTSAIDRRRVIVTVITFSIGTDVVRVKSGTNLRQNFLLAYWTGTVAAGTNTTSRHLSTDILFCAGTPNNPGNKFLLSYETAPACLHNLCPKLPCRELNDQIPDFDCSCEPGLEGGNCDLDINECASIPCQHSGNCTHGFGTNEFSCACDAGWMGTMCEIDYDECSSSPCFNGVTCNNLEDDSYNCTCAAGWQGDRCDMDVDECASDPCQNGTVCSHGFGSNEFSCACATGWTGANCETEINECGSDPCRNGGICIDHVGNYTCICVTGFGGTHCDKVAYDDMFKRLSPGEGMNSTWYSYGILTTDNNTRMATVEVHHRNACPVMCLIESKCLGYRPSNTTHDGATVCEFVRCGEP